MSTNNAQNGRQLPATPRTAPPTDPRIRTSSASTHNEICKDFVWGICKKGAQCKFRHELSFESMKEILKFCHDFQNRMGCTRPDCGYLHTSSEEESLFLNTGKIPKALAERYAAMSTAPVAGVEGTAAGPSSMMYMAQPPPPPPAMVAPIVAAPPPPPAALLPALLAPPPPPPPPPPTTATIPMRPCAPVYSAPSTSGHSAPTVFTAPPAPPALAPPTSLIPFEFDPSHPPPVHVDESIYNKRLMDLIEAGPSKVKKHEDSECDRCETCLQRDIRIELYREQIKDLQADIQYNKLVLEAKVNNYEKERALLSSLVTPEMNVLIDACLEDELTPEQELLYNALLSLLDKPNNVHDTSLSSFSLDDTLLRAVGDQARRRNHSSDLTVLELLRNGNISERENHNKESIKMDVPGLVAPFKGQKVEGSSALPTPSQYQPPTTIAQTTQPYASAVPPAPAPAPAAAAGAFVSHIPAATGYQTYQTMPAAVQRPFFANGYSPTTNVPAAAHVGMAPAYQNGTRAPAPSASSTPATAAQHNGQTYTPYVFDKYPTQQYNSCEYNRYEKVSA